MYSSLGRGTQHTPDSAKLCLPGRGFALNAKGAPWKLLRKGLTTIAQTWSVISYSNLAPTSHTSDLNMDRARLVYNLDMKMGMDLSSIISGQISQMAQSNSSRLGFHALITELCIARRVVSNSLTFESLSPTINLAYIRKNCWNPEDPSITFPGSRKAMARALSDALVPAPAPVPPPPTPISASAGPSIPSSDVIVPMLQSIHHDIFLVMQSM